MSPIAKISLSPPRREDLLLPKEPDAQQLDNIKAHLDIVLLALEALSDISSDEMLKAAQQLNLDSVIADRVGLWRLRQSNPLRKSAGGRKKLDVEEARSQNRLIEYYTPRPKAEDAIGRTVEISNRRKLLFRCPPLRFSPGWINYYFNDWFDRAR
ncbi:MAG: DUF3038 domain-containing protein [Hydrococcus sp. Prado102]|nr:DUF3038 domain-containing protein [Hydrococcus sp. Prado102]